jgi:Ala-tRNA(Pro) deacylase
MIESTTLDRPDPTLLDWLAGRHVDYEVHEHDLRFTARSTAAAEGVDPRTFAKVVGLATHEGRIVLAVLDSTDHVDLQKARRTLDTRQVRLLSEAELTRAAPGCEVGAIPAVGALYGLPTYADYAVRDDAEISFNAGSHRYSVRVDRRAWEHACGTIYGDLAVDSGTPAWARS